MKKLFTLFCLVATVCAASAQSNYRQVDGSMLSGMKPAKSVTKRILNIGSSRAASTNIILDYDGNDAQYSADNQFDYKRYVWDLNSKWTNDDKLTLKYAAVLYDTLQFLDSNNVLKFVPKAAATVTLDSFDAFFVHANTTGTYDSLRYTVFRTDQKVVTSPGDPASTFTTPVLWDTLIAVNQTIPLTTGATVTVLTMYPNLSIPQGKAFGIRVDYKADTANLFQVLVGRRDECATACQAEVSKAGNNTAYYLNYIQAGTPPTNFSGYYENWGTGPSIFYDCDQNTHYTFGGCENFVAQNLVMPAYVTVSANFGAVITYDSLKGCPDAALNLGANAYGSNAGPYTYSWATTSGTLTSTSDEAVQLIVGNTNAVVTVTVTDANNATTSATVNVSSRGVNVSITGSNPLTINCGANATLISTVSGNTTGKNYTWSTTATGPAQSTIQVNTPGTYSVTVTNNSGCSAAATISVQYPGGLTNTVSFTNPPPPLCEDKSVTFTNTTARQNGWTPNWTFGDGNLGFGVNGTNIYTNPGAYIVTLQEDSAGCLFQSANVNITVFSASNGQCTTGIEDVTFANAISVLPNPTNGNVNIAVNGVEKNIAIHVYNILGSEVKAFNGSDLGSTFSKTFDFSDLANGTYLVKIQTADKTAIKRLTVSK